MVKHGYKDNDTLDYYGPCKSNPPSNCNPVYMKQPTTSYPVDRGNLNTDEACEVNRVINRYKNRTHSNDVYNNADYERCVVSSSNDASNKRKIAGETDVSTMPLPQTSRSSATKQKILTSAFLYLRLII